MASPLLLYDSLDVIGNGSFGIIRKVRRKADGLIFARKELNFERMTERDRKQIVAEVNILKDLHHDHIVRYHDRYVDRDAGILYITMEYCGGGDLSTVIKHAQRSGRPIPEDTIWNYFMQILLALNHCHHPNGHGRSSSSGSAELHEVINGGGTSGAAGSGKEKRPQILHRDLKPDNVFLDENNTVKLGDFGLSKALPQASFANTYVGTPYYMSPELMQEKAYDSKSDIWSLGCVIYELCALKPPFAEAKTHSELSILIRNGRIPPLPKGYSSSLASVIKAMLNLNPAMRPSAAQLLQHERIDLAHKVSETQKMLTAVKTHKANLLARERDLITREATLTTLVAQKDAELAQTRTHIQAQQATLESQSSQLVQLKQEVSLLHQRESEFQAAMKRKEDELAARISTREEEVMVAVQKREEEFMKAWLEWEANVRGEMSKAFEERMAWVQNVAGELEKEKERIEHVKREIEEKAKEVERRDKEKALEACPSCSGCSNGKGLSVGGRCGKTPLEEVKNILAPLERLASPNRDPVFDSDAESSSDDQNQTPVRAPNSSKGPYSQHHLLPVPVFETPMTRSSSASRNAFPSFNSPSLLGQKGDEEEAPPSAMKGVILTTTGECLPTPSPAEFAKLFMATPKVSLNFRQIFDSCGDDSALADGPEKMGELELGLSESSEDEGGYETDTRIPLSRRSTMNSNSSSSGSGSNSTSSGAGTITSTSTTSRRSLNRTVRGGTRAPANSASTGASNPAKRSSDSQASSSNSTAKPATRLRRPSIRARPSLDRAATVCATSTATVTTSMTATTTERRSRRAPSADSHSRSTRPPSRTASSSAAVTSATVSASTAAASSSRRKTITPHTVTATTTTTSAVENNEEVTPQYDLSDEENLPSPFLKKVERERITRTISVQPHTSSSASSATTTNGSSSSSVASSSVPFTSRTGGPRKSAGTLRALAVVNSAAAHAAAAGGGGGGIGKAGKAAIGDVRNSIAKAQRAGEEARRALLKPSSS
ncbi:hypothetical protein C8Q75DRAFT_779630 [Abortiporus biennis]|nr:hypothetical protein C8Q75DRAFT_779630 [Abortiporus biennis]